MSHGMAALSSVGLTQQVLILCVLALVAAGVIGLFWKYILPGAIIIGVVALFYVAPEKSDVKNVDENEQVIESSTNTYKEYLKDCMEIADYSKEKCEELWHKKENE